MKKVLIALLIVIVLIPVIIWFRYDSWVAQQELEKEESVHVVSSDSADFSDTIGEKLDIANAPNSESLKLTPFEFAYLLRESINESSDEITVEEVYIDPKDTVWDIHIKPQGTPWVIMTVHSEVDSIELYTSDISVGPFSLDSFGLQSFREEVNTAFRDAIINIDTSQLTGRDIRSIELSRSGISFIFEEIET